MSEIIVSDPASSSTTQTAISESIAVLSDLFEAQVLAMGGATAVRCRDAGLSYDELNQRANRLANHLRANGVRPGDLVGLHVSRDLCTLVGILGILKAGAGYLPLDPVYPAERIGFILADAKVACVVTDPGLADNLAGIDAPVFCPQHWSAASDENPKRVTEPHDTAYVIYTSGSTGKPKGVRISHRNVIRLFTQTEGWFNFGSTDVWTMFHSYSFDFSVWEMWGALLYGGTVVVVPQEISRSTEEFRALLERERVTVLNQTPSAFRQLIKADLAHSSSNYALRYIIFGGEALEFQSLRPWFDRYGDATPGLVNMYGITETTVHVTYRPVTAADLDAGGGSKIGVPIPDLTLHVLDEQRNPVPTGETGEMYVGGGGVALGYLNRPELNAERFIPDPFNAGGRLYRTGDLARRTEDGDIEYLGRIDHQVKLRGFRIEIGEIEATIAAYPGVREVSVIARDDLTGDPLLVAYVVAPGLGDLSTVLRTHMRATLPDYMVPAHIVALEALPLTENGKVDRRALPAPQLSRGEYIAPTTETEAIVARVWGEVLCLDRIGLDENFFELGGHSLVVIDLVQKLRARGLSVDAASVFLDPTVRGVAAAAAVAVAQAEVPANLIAPGATRVTPEMLPLVQLTEAEIAGIADAVSGGAANIQDIYPLTPLQEGMLFHHRTSRVGDIYLVTTLLGAETRAPLDAYAAALRKVAARHDILRTAFLWEGLPEPVQVVCRDVEIAVEELDLDPANGDVGAQLLHRYDLRTHRIDVRRAPLIQLFLAEDRPNRRWVMLRVHHHLLEDHTADEQMSAEIITILDGREAELPPPLPFRDFVVRARQVAQSEPVCAHFHEMLGDVDEPTLPFGLSDMSGGGEIREARRPVATDLTRRLRQAATRNQVSAAALFHLAWATVIARSSGRDDVVFGTVLFGRMTVGPDADRVVGPFINSLPIRLALGGASVAESLRQTHLRLAGLVRHEHASLAIAQAQSGVPSNTPLFSALINFRHLKIRGDAAETTEHAMESAIRQMGLDLIRFEERTNFPLELSIDDLGAGFMIEAQALAPVDPADICVYLETALDGLVTALETAPATPMTKIGILPVEARRHLIEGLNDTARDFGAKERLHRLIEAQVERTPDAVALEYEGETLSFAEINARANQLARVLRAKGVGPDVLVGLHAERSFEMVVAMVAILKAGGAYVPLDPSYPADRLANVIEDAAAPVVLAQTHLAAGLPDSAAEVIALDPGWSAFAAEDVGNLDDLGTPESLAYVIFTSGSTGRPKGAMNEHRGIVNRILWMDEEYRLTPKDVVLQKTPFSFDVSVWEFFWPLMTGARLVIARPDGHRDTAYLVGLVRDSGVTTMHFVPSMLRMFLDTEGLEGITALRHVMCSGEALPSELAQRFFRRLPKVRLHNLYGPTEAAVDVTYWECRPADTRSFIPIGRPIANTQMHVLDARMEPVPQGVTGELYIGGIQVGRGYVGRDDLTRDRFLLDPFTDRPGARLYKTGDLGRVLPDGAIEYLGRTDFQVKIRGQRLELSEIEAVLDHLDVVGQSVVMARSEGGDTRLVAYVVLRPGASATVAELRDALSAALPPYMVPAAFVQLDAFPLTSSGKVDRKALPEPEFLHDDTGYAAPRTPVEADIVRVWQDVLKIKRIGIHDNFFELGGHSLLAITVIDRLRRLKLNVDVQSLFVTPTIAALAASLGETSSLVEVPPNLIPEGCTRITPEMLPLAALSQAQIDAITAKVPGGVANVQDIYPLAPLQQGFLFHHFLTTEGDLYIMVTQFEFESRSALDRYIDALQWVVNRNDMMRSIFFWEGLDEPVQVVCREAHLVVEEVSLDPADGDIADQLRNGYNLLNYRFDMKMPPMIRIFLAYDSTKGRWIFHQLTHHLMDDQATVNLQEEEIEAYLQGRGDEMPPSAPFRNYVAQARHGVPPEEHEAFFRDLLGDVSEPTAPFGFIDLLGNGAQIVEGRKFIDGALARRAFDVTQKLGISTAALFHEAYALMLSRLTGRNDVVFGTVMLGRMIGGEGAGRIIGPCINTLPVRLKTGDISVREGLRDTQALLARLLKHEHAPLRLSQRCTRLKHDEPVFNSILNYRRPSQGTVVSGQNKRATTIDLDDRSAQVTEWFSEDIPGRKFIGFLERTNFPLTLSIDDFGDGFRLVSQVQAPIDPRRICTFMEVALDVLVSALEATPDQPMEALSVLPSAEQVPFDAGQMWLNSPACAQASAYWREVLADRPATVSLAPEKYRRSPGQGGTARHQIEIDAVTCAGLRALAEGNGASLASVVYALFGLMATRYAGVDDLIVAIPGGGKVARSMEDEGLVPIDALPLRARIDRRQTLGAFIQTVDAQLRDINAQGRIGYRGISRLLGLTLDPGETPLATLRVGFRDGDAPAAGDEPPHGGEFELSLDLASGRDGILADWIYRTAAFDPATVAQLARGFGALLQSAVAADADLPINRLSLNDDADRQKLDHDWQGKNVAYPDDRTLGRVFAERVAADPSATAIVESGRQVSFGAIDRRADAIAERLRRAGVLPGDRVGLCLDRSVDLIATIVATLKIGASFVPLGTTLPKARVAYLVEDSKARTVVTTARYAGQHGFVAPILVETLTEAEIAAAPRTVPAVTDPAEAAYLIYTSGSTGLPKGVVGTHRATLNRFAWMWRDHPFEPAEVMCQKTAITFVDAIWEILGPLLAGVPLVIVPQETVVEPRAFLTMLGDYRVTRLLVVPSLLRALLESEIRLGDIAPSLRLLFTSGERLPADLAARFLQTAPNVKLINLFGSSEVAADVTVHEVTEADLVGGEIPIGRPIDNIRLYVLDDDRLPVPIGATGELYVGGHGLAAGYFGRPEMTAERFLDDPFDVTPGARMFATGDRVRYRPDGALLYEGRGDNQVKLRGMRIDLGEIEAGLLALPGVGQAVAVLVGEADGARLDAYVTASKTAAMPAPRAIKRALADTLPDYMVPAQIRVVEALPLNASGKIDRPMLVALSQSWAGDDPASSPETGGETGQRILQHCRQLLGQPAMGVDDNFFDAGGHSLLALRLFTWIRTEFGRDLPISTLFRHPTIRDLAEVISEGNLGVALDDDIENQDWDTTTVIHPGPAGSSKRPLFLVGGVGGNVNNLQELGQVIGKSRPVIGFQTRGVLGHRPHATIEATAVEHIRYMRQHQPEGPYIVGGYSGGAYAALEIVRQLEAVGERVERLVILDFFAPHFDEAFAQGYMRTLRERIAVEFGLLRTAGPGALIGRIMGKRDRFWGGRPNKAETQEIGDELHHYEVMYREWQNAALKYRGGPVDAPVLLFTAKPYWPDDLAALRFDASLGWGDLSSRSPLRNVRIGSDHLQMVTGQSAVHIAKELDLALGA